MRENLLKVEDVAKLLNVHPQTVYRMAKEGKIPYIRIGRALRFNMEELSEWLKGQREQKKRRGRKASLDFPIV